MDIEPLLRASVTSFAANSIRPVVETDKVNWNARIRRNELYYRGLQYLAYVPTGSGFADYEPIGSGQGPLTLGIGKDQDSQSLYDYVLNFFQGDVDTFIAVIGARSPNVQAQARDLSNEKHIRMKLKADRAASWLYSHWNVELLHPQLVRGLALYGTMFSYTRFTVNPRRYGTSTYTKFSLQDVPLGPAYYQCFRCGSETPAEQAQSLVSQSPGLPPDAVPCSHCGNPMGASSLVQPSTVPSLVPNQTVDYPNGSVELSILNSSCITAPVWVPNESHAPWLIYETEEDKGAIAQAYPELRDKIYSEYLGGGGSSAEAGSKYTREVLTSTTGYVVNRTKNRWLHSLLWVTPSCYEYLPNDRSGQLRDWLLQKYPDGFKVPMVNGDILPQRIGDERLTSVWAACKPKPSEMLYSDPYFECMIQMQDCVNDSVSMLIEQAERSNPFVIADPEILNPDMLREYNNVPGEFKFAKPGSVGSLDKGFFRVPAAEMNDALASFIDKYLAWCREITGIQPAIFGGQNTGPEQTAREAEIRRNQALMKLNIPWAQCRAFWAATYENGVYQAAKYSGGSLYTRTGRGIIEKAEIEGIWQLAEGGWFMECEESMPETIGQRRDAIKELMQAPPQIQHKMGMDEPDNIINTQEAFGMAGWKVPSYDMIIRLHDIISQLSAGQPTPGQPGPINPMTGMPGPSGPPQPSIPFDGFLFDATLALPVVKGWLISDKGDSVRIDNPDGYTNVLAYAHQIGQAMPPPNPHPDPPKMTITANLGDMTPAAQQSIMQDFGVNVNVPPGTPIAISKEQQKAMLNPPPPHPQEVPGQEPHNTLALPPPGGSPPAPPPGTVPPSPLAAPPS